MAVKVVPEGDDFNTFSPPMGSTEFKLKQPPKYRSDFTQFCPEYLKARERVGEHIATLKNGRRICYFKDGNDGDAPVICMHGGGEGKWYFMQKEPIPGVQLISIDRYGYGKSDPRNDGVDAISGKKIERFNWDDVIEDMKQFIDALGFDEVIWWGFSIGSSWAQHLAAGLPDRTRGIIVCGCMSSALNKEMTKTEKAGVGKPPGCMNPDGGCCGCILKGAFMGMPKNIEKHNFDAAFDDDCKKHKEAKPRADKCLADDFWLSSKLDGILSNTRGQALMGDSIRSLFGAWKYGPQDIKCPIYIFQAKHDADMGSSSPHAQEFIKRVAPNCIALEWIEGAGHSFTVGPDEECRGHVKKAVEKMPRKKEQ